MKRLLCLLLTALLAQTAMALPDVPEHLTFCDVALDLTPEARSKIAEQIGKLQRSTTHFQSLVDRANIYFPFIDEAFELRQVPKDLKFISLQESSLISDIVSPSNAVGFWQFKEASGRESGLTIDAAIDERKHIFQSSLAAAKYFYTIARYYDNYIYAVIGYNRGPVGAIPYTDVRGYGSRRLTITGETHWYALHALAFKLAFMDAVGKAAPPMWLQPMNTHGETDVARLAARHDMSESDLRKYNTWILGASLPAGREFVYYVPRQGKQDITALRHVPVQARMAINTLPAPGPKKLDLPDRKPKELPPAPKPKPAPEPRDENRFTYLEPNQDIAYGSQYVRVRDGETLPEIAVHTGSTTRKLIEINGFENYHRPAPGDIIYLKAPKARKFHIVRPGQTLASVAALYGTTVEKLREKNGIKGNLIFANQKLSLKKKLPTGDKPVLIAVPEGTEVEETPVEEVIVEEEQPEPHDERHNQPKFIPSGPAQAGVMQADASSFRLPAFESKLVTHTVQANESLWKVAKKYGAYADVVKKLNNLSSNELRAGQTIKVLQVTDVQ